MTEPIKVGQQVWCRTANGEWWETAAAGPATSNQGRPAWLAIPVRGWDPDNATLVVNWPADAVSTGEPNTAPNVTGGAS